MNNNYYKFFLRKELLSVVCMIILEQGLVATSTFAIIKASKTISSERPDLVWFLLFLICLFLPYIPGIFARRFLERYQVNIYEDIVKKRLLGISNSIEIWAQRDRKESFLNGIGAELLNQVNSSVNMLFDMLTLALNIILNLYVLSSELDSKIAIAFSLGTFLAYFSFKFFEKKTQKSATKLQQEKNEYLSFLSRAWDNILLDNAIHKIPYSKKLFDKLASFNIQGIHSVTLMESGSVVTTYLMSVPVVATVLYLFFHLNSIEVFALMFTLPRQFQMITNVQIMISYFLKMSSLKFQMKEVLDLTMDKVFIFEDYINKSLIEINGTAINDYDFFTNKELKNGRYTVRGQNGAGKSVFLSHLKNNLQSEAYLLPAHSDLIINFETRGFSSGQKLKSMITFLMQSKDCPRFVLLDEWDANLDKMNRETINLLIEDLSLNHVVIEVLHGRS